MSVKRTLFSSITITALLAAGIATEATAATADDATTGTISGTVTFPAGAVPEIDFFDASGTDLGAVVPDPTGAYSSPDLPAGVYEVAFTDTRDVTPLSTHFYNNVITDDPTDPRITKITLGVNQDVTGINGTIANLDFTSQPAPKIKGTATYGKTLSVSTAGWATKLFEFQWYRGNAKIAGATFPTYTVGVDDQGKNIYVNITAFQDGYNDATVSSPAVKIPASKVKAGKATITGTAAIGKKVTASASGKWTAGKIKYSYQWLANGVAIPKAKKASFTVSKAVKGKKLSVAVIGSISGKGAARATSKSAKVG